MKILHNHLGYPTQGRKVALIQSAEDVEGRTFTIYDAVQRSAVFSGVLGARQTIGEWHTGPVYQADFSALQEQGSYVLTVDLGLPHASLPLVSQPFSIAPIIYGGQLISDLIHYLKSQRSSGIFDLADRTCPKFVSEEKVAGRVVERVDVHGGWHDASGDASKYLSHMSYTNFMNPQQIPQVVWNLIDGRDRLPAQSIWLDDRIVDEALHGADFLIRMLDPQGYFYMTVFDRWSKDVEQREICSYTTQKGHKFDTYQAGFRQGGGSAIAALARASRLPRDGEFSRIDYLTAAEKAFAHLQQHNLQYLDNGQENIIDDYCALLAATELFATTSNPSYEQAAEQRARKLIQRQSQAGWFWADDQQTRSYFHAAEAGLPSIALLRFIDVAPNSSLVQDCRDCVQKAWEFELSISVDARTNPFNYPRQYIQMPNKAGRIQFFIPHENESGYWWQGENARLESLASAAQLVATQFETDAQFAQSLRAYAQANLNWIFGLNPFDACMMQGHGHNNPRYENGYWNAPGGVCNGITSGLENEEDIDFKSASQTTPFHSWRWGEQWIPHGAWLFHALSQQAME